MDPIFYTDKAFMDSLEADRLDEFEPNKWYFWDETWAGVVGPWETEEIARKRMSDYSVFLSTGIDPAQ